MMNDSKSVVCQRAECCDYRCLSSRMMSKEGLSRVDREVYESLKMTESEGQA